MKWIQVLGICFVMLVGLTGCKATDGVESQEPKEKAEAVETETIPEEEQPEVQNDTENNILIAYFTWADNTVVEDEEAAVASALEHYEAMGDADRYGADAIASASVVPPGNTAMLAEWIQEEVGGDLFSIQVTDLYPSDYNECMDRTSEEKSEDVRPELKTQVENFEQYDTIFLGFPNWWSSLPMPIYSFLEAYDFSGKTVIPFCAHGTGGVAATIRELEEELPENTNLQDVLGVYRADILEAQPDVQEWLKELGFIQ